MSDEKMEFVSQLRDVASRVSDVDDHVTIHLAADEIERLRRPSADDRDAIRREALEECAKIAEAVSDDRPEGYDPMYWAVTRDVAEAMRARLDGRHREFPT